MWNCSVLSVGIALAVFPVHYVFGHISIISPCPRYSADGLDCPALPAGQVLDYDMNSPLSSATQDFANPICKYTEPWPTPAATWTAGETVKIQFNHNAVSHSGGHAEFSISYDGGKTFVVIEQVLRYAFVGSKPAAATNEVSVFDYDVTLPANLPSSDNAIFAWSWCNASGNREFYMNCADVAIKGTSTSITGKNITIVNYPGYPTVAEFNMNYEEGINYYTSDATFVTVYGDGKSEAAQAADSEITYEGSKSTKNTKSDSSEVSGESSSVDIRVVLDSVYSSDDIINSDYIDDKCDNESDYLDNDSDYPNESDYIDESDYLDESESDYLDESDFIDDKCDDESDNISETDYINETDDISKADDTNETDDSTESDYLDDKCDDSSDEYDESEYLVESSDDYSLVESTHMETDMETDSSQYWSEIEKISSNTEFMIYSETELSELDSLEDSYFDSIEFSSSQESHYAWPVAFSNEPELLCDINSDNSMYYAYGNVYYSGVYVTYAYLSSDYIYNELVVETMESLEWIAETLTLHETITLTDDSFPVFGDGSELDDMYSREYESVSNPATNDSETTFTNETDYPMFEFSMASSSEIM